MVKQLLVLAVTLASLRMSTPWAIGGCQSDKQCKGERRCENGVCVSRVSKEAPSAAPAPTPGTWLTDQRTTCRVWDPNPKPKESITWSGACQNGLAEGQGTLEWFEDGKSTEIDQGDFQDGKMSGHNVLTFATGERFEGEFRDSERNGYG